MGEVWKSFRHGYYEVSNYGRVRRVKSGKVIKDFKSGKGYRAVDTCVDGKRKRYYVHILVARKFIGPVPEGKEVNHKDLIKSHNRWDNLEYTNRAGNMKHARKHGVLYGQRFRDIDVISMRRLRNSGHTYQKIGKLFGTSKGYAWLIVNRNWKGLAA